jgi:uncharacterized protein (TIGR02271 family)
MAKTLVGLYDTLTDAEQVARALVTEGFPRSAIRVAALNGEARRGMGAPVGEWLTADNDAHIVATLTDLGVPVDEARAYAEGVRRGGALVIVESSDEWTDRGLEIMHRWHAVDIDERTAQWRQEGGTGAAARAGASPVAASTRTEAPQERQRPGPGVEHDETAAIPVVEEEVAVGKRAVERGRVRIHTRVAERPVEEAVRLREERVTVERRPADRPATAADLQAGADETIEVTETAEEPVVRRRARVVEEVVVHKEAAEHTETVRDTVRRTDVAVDREGAVPGFATHAAAFRQHHTTTCAGTPYAEYEPAYRYGYDLGTNQRYHGRDWAALEADARRDWEARQPGTWERFKDAVRYGWHTVRARS